MTPLISLKNISKTYTDHRQWVPIYDNLNRSVNKGDYVAIMGRSGSGKTTLLNMLAGIISDYTGELTVIDNPLHTYNDEQLTHFRSQHISFVFQDFLLLPQLTVAENIDLVIDMNKRERVFETQEIIDLVWLTGKENRYVSVLSGWEQQRVALARAFVAKTDVLLADEPTGNLDEENAHSVMKLMGNLHKKTWATIVMITHDATMSQYAHKQYKVADMWLKKIES